MKKSPEVEEYLELLRRFAEEGKEPRVKDIASRLGVSSASASEMIRKLANLGFVRHQKYGKVALTRKGEREGGKILKRHRIIERFLALFGFPKKRIHREACALEHAVSDEVERVLSAAMEGGRLGSRERRLHDMAAGETGTILRIEGGRAVCLRLYELGLVPGTKVTVRRTSTRHGPIEVCVRSSCLALGMGVARKVIVKVEA